MLIEITEGEIIMNMKTKKSSELSNFGKANITAFIGDVAIGKSYAIMQTVSMNPDAVAIFLNGKLFSDYIRNDDVIVDVDSSIDRDKLISCLSVPMAIKGSHIFMNRSENAGVLPVMTEIMKQHMNIEYILVFNQVNQDASSLMEGITGIENARIFLEAQYMQEVDREILCKADRVLFKTPNAIVKFLHGKSDIEKTRATLKRGEALYLSSGHEICKVCF